MLEDTEDAIIEQTCVSKFRQTIQDFTFDTPQASLLRSSGGSSAQRNVALTTRKSVQSISQNPASPSKKRTLVGSDALLESPSKTKKKRGYAAPETYAHLDYLTDCLSEYLDVLFCGINPGVHSATVGHHFAHPGNRFYKMLHGSGFTDRLIPAEQDNTLPALYQIGITDLVDRPSSCEDELSSKEMIDSVPSLLQKVVKYKPRLVCFIGKGMGQKVEKGFERAIIESEPQPTYKDTETPTGLKGSKSPRKQSKGASPTKGQRVSSTDTGIGLRPYKVIHQDADSLVRETLFFISHSSSGLAASMNLQGKVENLKELRNMVSKHKDGTLDTISLKEVPV